MVPVSNSVPEPKRSFPDLDPTFKIIPDPDPAPDPFPDPGQNQIFQRTQKKLHTILKCLELDFCTGTVFTNF